MAETITTLISQDKVEKRITEMAEQISKDYAGRELRMVGILKGACFFLCELAKQVTVPVSIDFMQASSYGGATESTGTVRI
ncbi:MAG: phosphoribosyltransferase, partial [Lachnospiraceae bacterium]